jgi:hypothetical protein
MDDTFVTVNTDESLNPINNKCVLSIINDFEDGNWRYSKFQNFIWDNIAETALSHRERSCLVNHSLLTSAAKNLRLSDKETDIGRGSELAEIFLYGIMKHHFKALPVVPKIFYKQNSRDNAKGADSVHIVVDDTGDYSIWFGEAKFYKSIENARLGSIVESVGNSLLTKKLKKENSIITNVSDIDELIEDDQIRKSIKNALSNKESIDSIKPKLHVPILLLHECAITKSTNSLDDGYRNQLIEYHKQRAQAYFSKQINTLEKGVHLYSEISFHIILFPVPEKDPIVEKFVAAVEFYQGQ